MLAPSPRQSALMPANFTTLPHFSVSSAISLPKSAGALVPMRCAIGPSAQQRPQPDVENFGEEVSWRAPWGDTKAIPIPVPLKGALDFWLWNKANIQH